LRKLKDITKPPVFAPDVETFPVDVPVGGWDAISPLAKMDPKYAVTLINWVSRTGWVELRQGFQAWMQGLGTSAVESLMVYRPAGPPQRMYAACNGSIFDVTLQGTGIVQQTGRSSNRNQYINFTPAGGANYLAMVNGSDPYTVFNGTAWSQPVVTGVSSSTFINIANHKRRMWFVQENSTSTWFLGTDSIQGAAVQLDLGSIIMKGGYVVAIGTWTIDGGLGPDDYWVAVTSRGELVMYKGTDPTNASAWAIVGVFSFPPPLGFRCFCDVGSDLWMISLEGIIPVSQGLPFDPSAIRSVAITNRIQNAMLLAGASYQNNFGWEMITFPAQALAFLNVPVATNGMQQQYVTNMITGAWCQFVGWNANCFALFNDLLYFGDNSGSVQQAYTGIADQVSPIIADMKCAFNYFGNPGKLKRMTMARPFLVTSGQITPTLSVDADFADNSPSTPVSSISTAGALYDVSLYDSSFYAAGNSTLINWLSTEGLGTALALRMKVNVGATGAGGQSVFDTGVFDTAVFDGFATASAVLQVNVFNTLIETGAVI
jgi:hypothetical protein